MKVDYISRDDVLNEIHRFRGYIDEDMEYRMKSAINKIPSADVAEVKHGEWLPNKYIYDALECSFCGYFVYDEEMSNFCPKCGADMRGGT